jgi:hypothetical protein
MGGAFISIFAAAISKAFCGGFNGSDSTSSKFRGNSRDIIGFRRRPTEEAKGDLNALYKRYVD